MKKNKKYWEFRNKENRGTELRIYGEITKFSWWDETVVTASDFARELEELKDTESINLCINSPGGSVTEAHAIYNMLKRYAKANNVKITTHIDGVAASAASYIAMAGDEICMGLGASLMIHNVNGGAWGESKDLRKTADLMDKLKENIIDIYMTQSNLSREVISNLMNEETWMTPEEALEYGFIDKIETYETISDDDIDNLFTREITNSIRALPPRISELRNVKKQVKPVINQKPKGEDIVDINTIRNDHPDLYQKIREEAVLEERNRMKALDAVPAHNQEAIDMINKAKYEEPQSAEKVAYNIVTSDSFKAHREIVELENEQKISRSGEIKPLPPQNNKNEKDEKMVNSIVEKINKMRGQ